ncbi:MAG TPA: hypothetical protein PK413_12240 [Thermoanaerobaculia bacterium]|nr:hypothetical protein [Thermoanaerobaculia bacterium]
MKKFAILAVVALAVGLLGAPAAWAGTWNGWVTDDHCGAAGAKAGHEKCAKECVKGGGKYVFYNSSDKKIYHLDNQELAGNSLGFEVTVTGELAGDSIKVSKIEKKAA